MAYVEEHKWHSIDYKEVLTILKTSEKGLTEEEAKRRLEIYGPNELEEKKKSVIRMFIEQFTNFLIIILLISAAIAAIVNPSEWIDSAAIILIVLIMAIVGFWQEYSAEKTIEALKQLAPEYVTVLRDGEEKVILARELVPGDIIILKEGDKIPADARLIETLNLDIDESSLTGESTPVVKDAKVILPEDIPVSDRRNMVFMGTHVIRGKGKAVVVATGMRTEVGKIAKMIAEAPEEKTPLERELDYFGKVAGIIILGISGIVAFLDVFIAHQSVIDAILLAVALAVAAIPEGLPAIATAVLAIGAKRMAKRNALVKKLAAVEALGSCDVIASDKTGTITKGEMTVKKVVFYDAVYDVTGIGFEPKGEIIPREGSNSNALNNLLEYAAAHTSEDVKLVRENDEWKIKGSTTEGAALVLAYKGLSEKGVKEATEKYPLVGIIPFDRFRKRKTTIHRLSDSKYLIISSGAPELLLEICDKIVSSNGVIPLTDEIKKEMLRKIEDLAGNGYRTFAFAYSIVDTIDLKDVSERPENIERNLTFLAVLGIIDPPREGVKQAIEVAKRAGIKVIMVTGDHKLTAMAVGKMIGLEVSEDTVLEGRELDQMSDEELEEVIDKITIFARVTPEHKARIVKALKKRGHVVAMTGDGVNDAPALKLADIGIAMGIRGTDVAKEAAQLILLDDNFVTIVEAVREGRIIFENLKKPINYLLTCNFGEVAAVFGGELLGLPPIFRPIHLLWINVVTDSLPAVALGLEPPEPGIMERPPRKKHERFVTPRKLAYYTITGIILAFITLYMFISVFKPNDISSLIFAQTLAFTTIVLSEFGRALASRSENIPIWRLENNKWLWIALFISLLLQLLILYIPYFQEPFGVIPIPLYYYPLLIVLSLVILVVDEIRKALKINI